MNDSQAQAIAEDWRLTAGVDPSATVESVERRLIQIGADPGPYQRQKAWVVRFVASRPHEGHWVELAIGEDGQRLRVERCF